MFKTAEAVTPRHPDKMCDIISDVILDACLAQDSQSRVAIETMGGHNIISLTGELSTKANINFPDLVRGIVGPEYGIQTNIVNQSREISQGVDSGGAGDQGIMVGYACHENEAFMPQETYLAKSLAQYIYHYYPNDGKVQITMDERAVETIVASFCQTPKAKLEIIVNEWRKKILIGSVKNVYLNPAGDWDTGGFNADTGLTGRKLACDNYGPQIPIGGGAFSGKDATKVDRSGAYMARKIAVDLLKKYEAQEVLVKLAYAIGRSEPVMATAQITNQDKEIYNVPILGYDLSPIGIITFLDLDKPQYRQVAEWGSFGQGFRWDR